MLSADLLILRSLVSVHIEDTDRVRVEAEVIAQTPAHTALEETVARLSLQPSLSAVRWAARLKTQHNKWSRRDPSLHLSVGWDYLQVKVETNHKHYSL
jgi:hypothetical protein